MARFVLRTVPRIHVPMIAAGSRSAKSAVSMAAHTSLDR
jgi:hypothetical protein